MRTPPKRPRKRFQRVYTAVIALISGCALVAGIYFQNRADEAAGYRAAARRFAADARSAAWHAHTIDQRTASLLVTYARTVSQLRHQQQLLLVQLTQARRDAVTASAKAAAAPLPTIYQTSVTTVAAASQASSSAPTTHTS